MPQPHQHQAHQPHAAAAAAGVDAGGDAAACVDPALLDLAHDLADAAGRITTQYFR